MSRSEPARTETGIGFDCWVGFRELARQRVPFPGRHLRALPLVLHPRNGLALGSCTNATPHVQVLEIAPSGLGTTLANNEGQQQTRSFISSALCCAHYARRYGAPLPPQPYRLRTFLLRRPRNTDETAPDRLACLGEDAGNFATKLTPHASPSVLSFATDRRVDEGG